MGAVKEYAFTHSECPICGRCYLAWETKSGITCGRPECDNEADQLFEEIADNQQRQEDSCQTKTKK